MKRTSLRARSFSAFFLASALAAGLGAAACAPGEATDDGGSGGSVGGEGGAPATGGETATGGLGGDENTGGTGGEDGLECAEPRAVCDDECVDLETDFDHCGECGHACEGSQACVDSECTDRSWGITLTNIGSEVYEPIVQLDGENNAFIVSRVWVANTWLMGWRIDGATGEREDLTPIEHTEAITAHRFALNDDGDGVLAFVTTAAPRKLYAAYFEDGEWSEPVLVDDSGKGVGYFPYIDTGVRVFVHPDGSSTIVYPRYQSGSDGAEDVVAVHSEGIGEDWSEPAPLEDELDTVGDLDVTSDGAGHLLATWAQDDRVWVSAGEDGSFAEPVAISNDELEADEPKVALSAKGTAMVVFAQRDESYDDIYRAWFDGEAWSEPAVVADSANQEEHPGVALRPDGSGILSYKWKGGVDEDDKVFAVHFESVSDELDEAAELTETSIVMQYPRPFVGPGRSGGVFWANMEDLHRTRIAFTEGDDFEAEWQVPSGLYHAVIPSIDYSSGGDGMIVWHDSYRTLGFRAYEPFTLPE